MYFVFFTMEHVDRATQQSILNIKHFVKSNVKSFQLFISHHSKRAQSDSVATTVAYTDANHHYFQK